MTELDTIDDILMQECVQLAVSQEDLLPQRQSIENLSVYTKLLQLASCVVELTVHVLLLAFLPITRQSNGSDDC